MSFTHLHVDQKVNLNYVHMNTVQFLTVFFVEISMKPLFPISLIALSLSFGMTLGAYAQDSLGNVSTASGDSLEASARLAEAGVKTVVGVVALPFVAVGAIAESGGGAVRQSGEAVWDSANGPLEIGNDTVIAQGRPSVPYEPQTEDDKSQNSSNQKSRP
jgi:hypothetical protein